EAHGELDPKRFTPLVRAQLLKISGATIDRLLKPTRDAAKPSGLSATKAGPLLRNSITVRKAGDEHEQAPGFIEADMVVHCGPTLAGEFARTLTATDVFTGWTENVAVRNGAHKWVLGAMDDVVARLPFPMVGLDTDNGGEFINHALIKWADDKDLYFTRARPYKSNDNAHVEQKNGDVVRRHAFHYRYDTALELRLLNELYALVRVRLNLFTATTKAVGWRSNKHGKKARIYDKPRTPYQRVLDSGILSQDKATELAQLIDTTNPADLTRGITAIQNQLIKLAAEKTRALEASSTRAQIAEASTILTRAS
ncbi:DDE-type integrase/transposase/recombinase, partial [Arthrobacter sp. H5]|uniref:integrase catalytic domain-containing protein n=1 Tax=Arthrobacter sp. H5 TaxID=1267973 RepID=UPI00068797A9